LSLPLAHEFSAKISYLSQRASLFSRAGFKNFMAAATTSLKNTATKKKESSRRLFFKDTTL